MNAKTQEEMIREMVKHLHCSEIEKNKLLEKMMKASIVDAANDLFKWER